jgi:hypothetical protein
MDGKYSHGKKKKNRKWRMCIDFTDLNKCCREDDFPLSRIDKVVDSAAAYEMMSTRLLLGLLPDLVAQRR